MVPCAAATQFLRLLGIMLETKFARTRALERQFAIAYPNVTDRCTIIGLISNVELGGAKEIEQFLGDLLRKSEPWNSLKLVFLGHGRIGKTTLVHALKNIIHPYSAQTVWHSFFVLANFDQEKDEIISTVGIDCDKLNIDGGEVMIWDFAGQQEYTATHHHFLSSEVSGILLCVSNCSRW